MAEQLNLVQKLAKIRAMSDVVSKEKRGYNYSYADITSILANITSGMKKYGVSLIPSIVPSTASIEQNVIVNTKFDKTGKPYEQKATEMLVRADMMFTWVNDENPEEKIEVPWFVTGSQGDPSQALGSGLTYCTRYFLTNYFQIAQADSDVDAYRSKQKSAEVSEDKAMPSLGMVTINALSAADSVIIPVQAQYLPAKGMTQLVQTISRVKKRINPGLKIDGMQTENFTGHRI